MPCLVFEQVQEAAKENGTFGIFLFIKDTLFYKNEGVIPTKYLTSYTTNTAIF